MRKITYFKRRKGLLKKAIELSIGCKQEILLFCYDQKEGRLVEFNSSPNFNIEALNKITPTIFEKFQNEDYSVIENLLTPLQFERAQTKFKSDYIPSNKKRESKKKVKFAIEE